MIGAIALASSPAVLQAAEVAATGCNGSCSGLCSGCRSCTGTCSGLCEGCRGCSGTCSGLCQGCRGDKWYNLSGQRVDALKKGIYIRNGRKIVIRQYDIW